MSDLINLSSNSDLDNLLENAGDKTVLIFKRSTTCPISRAAHEEYLQYLGENKNPEIITAVVTVQDARDVSNEIAHRFGIKHESPQLLLIKNGQVKFHCSHYSITCDTIINELANN